MEILLGLVIVVVALLLLAAAIRVVLVFVAKRNGYDKNQIPLHYHIFGVGTYFSVFWLALYLLHIHIT